MALIQPFYKNKIEELSDKFYGKRIKKEELQKKRLLTKFKKIKEK